MDSPSHTLRHEHEAIERLLDAMDRMGAAMERGEPVPRGDVLDALDVAHGFADRCHHAKEETVLFPALLDAIPASQRIVQELEGDHAAGRRLVAGMKERASAGEEPDAKPRAEFAQKERVYSKMLRAHIDRETTSLLPLADRLGPRHQAALADAFERVEREEVGSGAHERFESSIERLHARWVGDGFKRQVEHRHA